MSHDWLLMTLERRRDLITVLEPYFLPKILHSTKSYFIKAIDHTFYGFTGVTTHLGCWENTRKACKSLAFGYIEFTVLKAFTSELKLRTNPVKAFNGMCVRLMSITFPII